MINYFQSLEWSMLGEMLIFVVSALLCITIHELSHGFAAYKLGDNTAKEMGRLTLNPIKHIDPIGLIMIVFVGFGWAKPVPVNMLNFKKPKAGMALTALAGPVSNIILAVVVMFILGLFLRPLARADSGSVPDVIMTILARTAYLSVMLAVFNMLPIPPLDGSKILFSLASDETYFKLMQNERFGMIIILILILTDKYTEFFSKTVIRAASALMDIFYEITIFAHNLVS